MFLGEYYSTAATLKDIYKTLKRNRRWKWTTEGWQWEFLILCPWEACVLGCFMVMVCVIWLLQVEINTAFYIVMLNSLAYAAIYT